MDAEAVQEAHDIARPADGDRGGAERVFQNQIPADDPGDEFAHRRVGIGVGAAGDGHGRSHLGIAQAGKRAGDAADDEREHDGRAGIASGGLTGQHKDAGADDCADAEGHQVQGAQGALQPMLVVCRFGFKLGD